jgi:hypothetical protein
MNDNKCPIKSILTHAAPVLTVLLLGGILAMDKLRVDPSIAAPFLKRTATAIEAVPKASGDWRVQREFVLAPEVIKLLDVNAYLNRSYTNIRSGQSVELLLVQCRDARAMQGHFPPICYPSSGCQIRTLGGVQQWTIRGGSTVPGMEYEVIRPDGRAFIVRDFFVLPNGKFATDMNSVMAAAKNYQELVFGGTQVQVLFDANVSSRERGAIFSDLMFPYADLLEVLRSAQWSDTATGPAASTASVAVTPGYSTAGNNRPD